MKVPAVLGLALVLAAPACDGGPATVPRAAAGAAEVADDAVPGRLGGLRSEAEDVTDRFEELADRAFVTSVRLWSLREGERLQATLSVQRFASDASPEERGFQRSVVAQIGQAQARPRMFGDQLVYVTPGNRQTLYMWFTALSFVVMSVSVDHPTPRALVREATLLVRA